jgi:hypothetical protein
LLKKTDLLHIFEETNGKIRGVRENQAYLELVPVANGTAIASVREKRATCSAACIQLTLTWRFTSTRLRIRSTSTVRTLLRGKSASLSDGDDQWRQTSVGSEVYAEDTSECTTLQLLHLYHGFRQELRAYQRIL